jgi:hypothetical protein
MAHALCVLDNKGYIYTLRICNTYCFSTATVVTGTRPSVTLYLNCLSCLSQYWIEAVVAHHSYDALRL